MFLAASPLRFAITGCGMFGEQQIDCGTSLPTGQWVHVAVTVSGSVGTIYVNGVVAGQNTNMAFTPSRLFATTENYIGKSRFNDPYLNGKVDDFRIYRGVLSAADVQTLAAGLLLTTPPTGVLASPASSNSVSLTWTGACDAASYNIKRSSTSGGPYTTLATGVTATGYTDTGLAAGTTYYYVVSSVNTAGEGANSNEDNAAPSDLSAYLRFDETSGTTAIDSSGNGWTGTLVGGGTWAVGRINNAVGLTSGSSQYVTLPAGLVSTLNDFTISAWVKPATLDNWARVFDFGSGTGTNMFLTTQNGANGKPRFGIKISGSAEQQIDAAAPVAAGTWAHIAVTLSGSTGVIYVNGVASGSNSAISFKPSGMGSTTQNYLGKSQYPDPYLNGALDDFRIYNRAFTAAEVLDLATPAPEAPPGLAASRTQSGAALTWNAVSSALSYTVKRSLASGGPYATIASGLASPGYTDTSVAGTLSYYYVVSATGAKGEGSNSVEASATPSDLFLHLRFDDAGGATAVDSSGNARNATLLNGPTFTAGVLNNALGFTGTSSQYATLPAALVSTLNDFTISAWVKLTSLSANMRIFDFGTSTAPGATTGAYMFLTPSSGSAVRFAITTAGYSNEQSVSGTAPLATGTWVHVAVTLSGSAARIYVNGVLTGSNNSMTLHPSSLGSTTQNYLGRSQWPDPYFNGALDDFRIYSRALSANDVAILAAAQLPAPQNVTAAPGSAQIALSWNAVSGATGYTVRQASNSGGPFTDLATGVTATTYLNIGLAAGATWHYTVAAAGLPGTGAASAPVSATTYTATESWRFEHFGTIANSGNAADGADPDGDGWTNTQEFISGTDPNDRASLLKISSLETHPQDVVIGFPTVIGKNYRVEKSGTLAGDSWSPVAESVPGTGATLEITDVGARSQPQWFYRIVVSSGP